MWAVVQEISFASNGSFAEEEACGGNRTRTHEVILKWHYTVEKVEKVRRCELST